MFHKRQRYIYMFAIFKVTKNENVILGLLNSVISANHTFFPLVFNISTTHFLFHQNQKKHTMFRKKRWYTLIYKTSANRKQQVVIGPICSLISIALLIRVLRFICYEQEHVFSTTCIASSVPFNFNLPRYIYIFSLLLSISMFYCAYFF